MHYPHKDEVTTLKAKHLKTKAKDLEKCHWGKILDAKNMSSSKTPKTIDVAM